MKKKILDLRESLKKDWLLYLMLVPFLLWYVFFRFKPIYGLQIAFRDYSPFLGIAGSPWVGLANFKDFLFGPYFSRIFKNTVIISLYGLIFAFPVPIVLALLLNEVKNTIFKKTVQTFTYLPHFISAVVVVGMVTNFLSPSYGIVNSVLDKIGLDKIYFLAKAEYFRTIFISMGIWKTAGYGAIIYIAALAGVDPQLYEAAIIDGANRWKQTIYVTLPSILPTITIMLILRIGRLLQVSYEQIILLYQPATYETADVINTFVYRQGLQGGQYAIATTAGLFNAIVGFVLVVSANKISKKVTETGLW